MCPYKFYYSSCSALGIGAASFASVVYGASKDIAESPTAIAGTPKEKYPFYFSQFFFI